MAINFANNAAQSSQPVPDLKIPTPEAGLIDPEPYDIQADRESLTRELEHSPEIDALTSAIGITDAVMMPASVTDRIRLNDCFIIYLLSMY